MTDHPKTSPPLLQSNQLPWIASMVVVFLSLMIVRSAGRLWWCACNQYTPWSSDAWGSHNSQHLFDPYSFTHMEHGFVFCGVLFLAAARLDFRWRFCLSVIAECLWEILENSSMVIERFRGATAAQGYYGDSVANVLGDNISCALGFLIASHLGWRRTIILTIAIEVCLLVSIRDNLLLSIVMLVWPIDPIKSWQMG